eukprot:TRINITY_DN38428_c0_g2_i3.p2 TRINITY_DN38428_c0_g2~~TRINITY_DN38428_c0_g2_i3.p2  ORF type:complete len:178 (-),score=8.07 TRINITY_DN38428_c0_g2_i3:106-639(-)
MAAISRTSFAFCQHSALQQVSRTSFVSCSRCATCQSVAPHAMVYDVDGDGLLTHDDLRNILSYLVGGQLTEEQIQSLLKQIEEEAGTTHGIDFDLFQTFAQKAAKSFEVQVPTRLQISCGMSAAYRPLCPGFEEASRVHGALCDLLNAATLRTQRDVLCAIGTCLLLTLAEGVQPFY